jgi:hypothetical protein
MISFLRPRAEPYLSTGGASAERSAPLQSVGITRQPRVLNARQLCTAYTLLAHVSPTSPVVLTVVDVVRNATTSLAIDIADVLLQARVRSAASTVRDGPASVLRLGRGEGEEGEESDCEGELHVDGGWVYMSKSHTIRRQQ